MINNNGCVIKCYKILAFLFYKCVCVQFCFRGSHSTLRLNSPNRVVTNSDVSTDFADTRVLQSDTCHPPVFIEIHLALHNYNATSHYKYLLLQICCRVLYFAL